MVPGEGRIHTHHHSLELGAQGEACILRRRHRNRHSCWAVVLEGDPLGAHNLREGLGEGRSLVVDSLADSSADTQSYHHNHRQEDLGEVHKDLEIRNPPQEKGILDQMEDLEVVHKGWKMGEGILLGLEVDNRYSTL